MICPEEGLTTKAKLTRVIDGDTIEVEVRRTVKVRLDNIRAAEKNTKEGSDTKEFVENLLKDKELTLFVPAGPSEKYTDIQSFDRVIGHIFVGKEKRDLGEILLENCLVIEGKKEGK